MQRPSPLAAATAGASLLAVLALGTLSGRAAAALQTPEQFIGFRVGADNKLARWDTIVDYMRAAAAGSDRVRVRELGTRILAGLPGHRRSQLRQRQAFNAVGFMEVRRLLRREKKREA